MSSEARIGSYEGGGGGGGEFAARAWQEDTTASTVPRSQQSEAETHRQHPRRCRFASFAVVLERCACSAYFHSIVTQHYREYTVPHNSYRSKAVAQTRVCKSATAASRRIRLAMRGVLLRKPVAARSTAAVQDTRESVCNGDFKWFGTYESGQEGTHRIREVPTQ